MTSLLADDRLFEMKGEPSSAPMRVPVGAAKTFRPYDPTQSFLLPPSLDDWLPQDHTARFISEVVDELLDLSVIYDSYAGAAGAPPYDPTLMLKLLLYAYSIGVTSSREMERRCHTDVAFRWLSANAAPDYRSLSRFRRRHDAGVRGLFVQVLVLCSEAGLVKLGRVALDGTKLRASASRHKAMSYDRLGPRIAQLQVEVAAILAEAEATDVAEDLAYGEENRGDEVPLELSRKETRLAKLRAAKTAIEFEAREKAAAKAERTAHDHGEDDARIERAVDLARERAVPDTRAQRNFTDPESRMMKTNDGFNYAYNAQTVVDETSQVIIGTRVGTNASDVDQLLGMIDLTKETLRAAGIDENPKLLLADAGYCTEDNLTQAGTTDVDVLIATGRIRRNERVAPAPRGPIPRDATQRERMARRLRTKTGAADYARRKAIVEPVFGQMKVRQHAGFLRLRGLEGAQAEWALHAVCHNLRKLANSRSIGAIRTA